MNQTAASFSSFWTSSLMRQSCYSPSIPKPHRIMRNTQTCNSESDTFHLFFRHSNLRQFPQVRRFLYFLAQSDVCIIEFLNFLWIVCVSPRCNNVRMSIGHSYVWARLALIGKLCWLRMGKLADSEILLKDAGCLTLSLEGGNKIRFCSFWIRWSSLLLGTNLERL
jgi:hypothetical protein